MKAQMMGYISNVAMKMDASSNLVKELKLDVFGDLSSLQELMKQPLVVTLETKQADFGDVVPEPSNRRSRKEKSK